MIPEIEKLSAAEVELMHKAPMLVCILIAGADDHIDKKEIRKAIALTEKKQKRAKSHLLDFYKEVGEDFEDKLMIIIHEYPHEEEERSPMIVETLSHLNPILKKIDSNFSKEFYKSLREIASEIAKSSGGLMGLRSVDDDETKYMALSMIQDPATY